MSSRKPIQSVLALHQNELHQLKKDELIGIKVKMTLVEQARTDHQQQLIALNFQLDETIIAFSAEVERIERLRLFEPVEELDASLTSKIGDSEESILFQILHQDLDRESVIVIQNSNTLDKKDELIQPIIEKVNYEEDIEDLQRGIEVTELKLVVLEQELRGLCEIKAAIIIEIYSALTDSIK